jgi:hypothetical protein
MQWLWTRSSLIIPDVVLPPSYIRTEKLEQKELCGIIEFGLTIDIISEYYFALPPTVYINWQADGNYLMDSGGSTAMEFSSLQNLYQLFTANGLRLMVCNIHRFYFQKREVSLGHVKPFRSFIAEVDITKGFDSI